MFLLTLPIPIDKERKEQKGPIMQKLISKILKTKFSHNRDLQKEVSKGTTIAGKNPQKSKHPHHPPFPLLM